MARKRETHTGGKPATSGVDPGRYALSVGKPMKPAPDGWSWMPLMDLARLETGHTPSRKRPDYWGGDVPWIGIRDATGNHGRVIYDTLQTTNELGIANSSARVLPTNTVCLSRTASVGYVVVMGRPMATSQDFVNWVCSDGLDWRFLKYVLIAEKESLLRYAHGTTHQTIYFPEVKAFHLCSPSGREQAAIADVLGALDDKIESNRRARMAGYTLLAHRFAHLLHGQAERVPLHEIASTVTASVAPSDYPARVFEQFSIPAWDVGIGPEVCTGDSMASAKTKLPAEDVVLLSKLNPATKRVWWPERLGLGHPVCSPEFIVLTPRGVPASWLHGCVAFDGRFYVEVLRAVSGTTGSRQRVKPSDVLAATVPRVDGDQQVRWDLLARPILDRQVVLLRETRGLIAVRDALLPKLVSGRIRVPLSDDVDEQLGAALEAAS